MILQGHASQQPVLANLFAHRGIRLCVSKYLGVIICNNRKSGRGRSYVVPPHNLYHNLAPAIAF